MSSIKLTADSGGGTFEIKAPASSGNTRSYTLPDVASIGTLGGVQMIDQYCLQANKSLTANTPLDLDADFVRVSGTIPGAGHIGTGMTKTGAIFSFPSTGIYKLFFCATVMINSSNTGNRYAENPILITTNNSTYTNRAMGLDGVDGETGESFGQPSTEFVFDVTDTSLCKCKFQVQTGPNAATLFGQSGRLDTFITFTRIGDT